MTTPTQQDNIIKNWEIFKSQIQKLADKSDKIPTFLESIEEDFMIAPASSRLDLVCAYPGGLVEHSLRVFSCLGKLRKIYEWEAELPANSVRVVSLLHDLGKIGIESKSYYKDQTDDWRKNKLGELYTVNDSIAYVPVSQISLRWLTNYNFKLNMDEWYSISSIRNKNNEEEIIKNEPNLAVLLKQAVKIACIKGKNKKEVSLITA